MLQPTADQRKVDMANGKHCGKEKPEAKDARDDPAQTNEENFLYPGFQRTEPLQESVFKVSDYVFGLTKTSVAPGLFRNLWIKLGMSP